MRNISLYKSLSEDDLKQVFTSKISFYFKNDSIKEDLDVAETNGNTYSLESSNGLWDSIENGLGINISIELINKDKIFTTCYLDSVVAVCAFIYSNESKFKKVSKLFEIDCNTNNQVFENDIYIDKETITGSLCIEFHLFLLKSGNGSSNSINNTKGAILGKFGFINVMLIGDSSLFPVFNKPMNNKPLWEFIYDIQDPYTDIFVDSCHINLNSAHKDYKLIDVNSEAYCDRVFVEIMKSSIFQFLCMLKVENALANLDDTFEDGSVLQVAKYLVKTHGIKVDSIESIAISLNDYFDKFGGK